MRLFKLIIIAIIIGSAYLFAKQHSENPQVSETPQNWQTVSITSGVTIQFPRPPISKSFQQNIPSLGKVKLTTYQTAYEDKIFILLWAPELTTEIKQRTPDNLQEAIHAFNDTTNLRISNKQTFVLQSHRGIEYKATRQNGNEIWCRTIIKGNQLFSIIYTSSSSESKLGLGDTFFESLRMQ